MTSRSADFAEVRFSAIRSKATWWDGAEVLWWICTRKRNLPAIPRPFDPKRIGVYLAAAVASRNTRLDHVRQIDEMPDASEAIDMLVEARRGLKLTRKGGSSAAIEDFATILQEKYRADDVRRLWPPIFGNAKSRGARGQPPKELDMRIVHALIQKILETNGAYLLKEIQYGSGVTMSNRIFNRCIDFAVRDALLRIEHGVEPDPDGNRLESIQVFQNVLRARRGAKKNRRLNEKRL